MKCPSCGAETPDEAWNCASCRINLYWASQHYEDLAAIREQQGLPRRVPSPPFLVDAHKEALEGREGDGSVEHKVRAAARRAMRKQS